MKLKEKFQRFWTLSKSRQGFTLVELIVVIAILAILAGVAIPVYNGYIKKAQTAADQTLLDSVNTAFAAACLENGIDHLSLTSEQAKMPLSGGMVNMAGVKPAVLKDAFAFYFMGNESSTFNTFKVLKYENGMFVEAQISDAYAALMDSFNSGDINALKNSTYGGMVDSLLGSVDMASNIAAGLLGEGGDDRITALIGENGLDSLAQYLGYADANAEGFEGAFDALYDEKTSQLMAANPNLGEDDARDAAYNSLMTNAAILSVATSTTTESANSFANALAGGTAKDTLKGNLEAGNTQEALSQAALTYALYTAYAEKNNIEVTQESAMSAVLNSFEDEGFQQYVAGAGNDVAGYVAAMNMMNTSAGNTDVVSDVLLNGFSDGDLQTLLQGVLG